MSLTTRGFLASTQIYFVMAAAGYSGPEPTGENDRTADRRGSRTLKIGSEVARK
jgi:hypothetical protein